MTIKHYHNSGIKLYIASILYTTFSICNMGTSGLPDMYTLRPAGPGCTYQVDHSNQCDMRYVTPWIPLILGVKVLHK